MRSLPEESDSQGCLLVVASYADLASTLERVTKDAATRLLMSPVIGDFIELRLVDLGHRPPGDGVPAAAVERIVNEITRPAGGASENYFGLLVVDGSAATVERLLDACRADRTMAALPLRCRGFAAKDDRHIGDTQTGMESAEGREEVAPPAAGSVDIVVPEAGRWTRRGMVDDLKRYAEDLLHHFATTHVSGLTGDDLDSIRRARTSSPEDGDVEADDVVLDLEPAAGVANEPAADQPLPGNRPSSESVVPALSSAAVAPSAHPMPPAGSAGAPSKPVIAARLRPAAPVSAVTVLRRLAGRLLRRPPAAPADPLPVATAPAPYEADGAVALVYLAIAEGVTVDDSDAWRRGRSLIQEIDKRIAAIPGAAYRIRVVTSLDEPAERAPRPPGELSRRDIRRSASRFDFIELLVKLKAQISGDLATIGGSPPPAVRPAVVVFAADVPMGDVVTMQEYLELVGTASVIWITPLESSALLSPEFAVDGVRVLTDHDGIADEVATYLRVDAGAGA
ncbi:hypothetical protein AB0O28_28825 [Microbispora sp. NPDC088329]|uniref:hypothetical protein n=1 Tax=Microbispora sp. NPDC088329 TaxID=3154869 RepID=UPI00341961B6